MFVLHAEGGSYMDFDHIVLRPMMHLRNAVGTEICHPENVHCLTVAQLAQYNVTRELRREHSATGAAAASAAPGSAKELPEEVLQRARFDGHLRFTPCNGVLINWRPKHPLFTMMLLMAERVYDPANWGCLGPRLLGRVLVKAGGSPKVFKRVQGSFHLLQASMLYPFSYETVAAHLRVDMPDTDRLVAEFGSIGMHFYGHMSAAVPLQAGSTMHRHLARSRLFGTRGGGRSEGQAIQPLWVVRKASQAYCTAPPPREHESHEHREM